MLDISSSSVIETIAIGHFGFFCDIFLLIAPHKRYLYLFFFLFQNIILTNDTLTGYLCEIFEGISHLLQIFNRDWLRFLAWSLMRVQKTFTQPCEPHIVIGLPFWPEPDLGCVHICVVMQQLSELRDLGPV